MWNILKTNRSGSEDAQKDRRDGENEEDIWDDDVICEERMVDGDEDVEGAESRAFMPHNTTDKRPAESKGVESAVNLTQTIDGIRGHIALDVVRRYNYAERKGMKENNMCLWEEEQEFVCIQLMTLGRYGQTDGTSA